MTVEHLSSDAFLDLWTDPLYRAKRRSEAEQNQFFCGSCFEGPCVCGEIHQLAAEFDSSAEIYFRKGAFSVATRPTARTLAVVAERDQGRCGYCGDEVYGERGEDWSLQHRRRAGMGGDRRPETHAPGNLILLCGSGTTRCHGHIEEHKAEAFKTGHAVSANATPTEQPIEHAVHGRVLLDDEGGWSPCESS